MDISMSGMFSSLLFGAVGIWAFSQGKKNQNIPVVVLGLVLMLYPYFTHGPLQDWGVGGILCGLLYYYF